MEHVAESLRRLGLEWILPWNGCFFVRRVEAGFAEPRSDAVNLREPIGSENRKLRWRVAERLAHTDISVRTASMPAQFWFGQSRDVRLGHGAMNFGKTASAEP